ncbi:MAG: class I SAM-dependent methyltransferase [Chromatiales bacterium]|nr:class I SAM-dependent methyltransferase [Chromatiales bacterium]
MSFYADRIMPRLISAGMQNKAMRRYRPRIPSLATGRVLEVGIGSGLNLPYYGREVTCVVGLEPSGLLRDEAAEAARQAPFPVDLLAAGAESIPLATGSVDTVVSTWTLCSIPDLDTALGEIRRVLRPGGRLLFFEHGRAPDLAVSRWQDRLAPLFRGLAGCNPNRQIDASIEGAGFRMLDIERAYLDGPRFISWHFVGQAVPN